MACAPASRSVRVYDPQRVPSRPEDESAQHAGRFTTDEARFPAHLCASGKSDLAEKREITASLSSHALFQESFYLCTVKSVGELDGARCIYVEIVMDRDSGVAFAKVYSAKNALNAADILESRALPFFERHGAAIAAIHTRKNREYCGVPPVHPFETFLAAAHIPHLPIDSSAEPDNYLCWQFYQFLRKEFFPQALRKSFHLSLDDLQKDLDAFIEAYNSGRMKPTAEAESAKRLAANSPVHL